MFKHINTVKRLTPKHIVTRFKLIFLRGLVSRLSKWLMEKDEPSNHKFLSDFRKIEFGIQPGDVLLVEGRNRVGRIVRLITHSPWTHAVLCIGRLSDIEDPELQKKISTYYSADQHAQLIIESHVGIGTTISPLTKYKDDHVRILRPQGISPQDCQRVLACAFSHLGRTYDLWHIFDLARYLLPWGLFPRRWRSSLFNYNPLQPTKDICSSLIAESFESVNFPILPKVKEVGEGYELIRRNTRLYTPSDFDYSPFFAVIKYPIFPIPTLNDLNYLPWRKNEVSNE